MNHENESPRPEFTAPAEGSAKLPPAESLFGEIIYAYTRAQAIDDGVLFDCGAVMWGSRRLVEVIGFFYPVAITAGAYSAISEGCEAGSSADFKIALRECLWSLRWAIGCTNRLERPTDRVHFKVAPAYAPHADKVALYCVCGPGDDENPVMTIMLEGED